MKTTPSLFPGLKNNYLASLALLWMFNTITAATATGTLRTVALTGGQAPGIVSDVSFETFSGPVLNDAGQTALRAFLAGTEVTDLNNNGIWSEGGDEGLTLVARKGNHAPGKQLGVNFADIGVPILNSAGHTAFRSLHTGAGPRGSNKLGIWSEGGSGELALVMSTESQAPGTEIGVKFFDVVGKPVLNNIGHTAFFSDLTSGELGIWSEQGGEGPALIVRSGDVAPVTNVGYIFKDLGKPILNDAGQIAFKSFNAVASSSFVNYTGIWAGSNDTGLRPVAIPGMQAPGEVSGAIFANMKTPVLNNAGHLAFAAELIGAGLSETSNRSIWSEGRGAGLAIVAQSGNQAPGTEQNVQFTGFSNPVLNEAGRTGFIGYLNGQGVDSQNNTGVWVELNDEGLKLVARSGAPVAESEIDVKFHQFNSLSLNDAGNTAFYATLIGDDVSVENNEGIWAEDRTGVLRQIAREGDLLDVNGDGLVNDLRVIKSLELSTNWFNNLGQVAFLAGFTDGSSGIFVSSAATVPEPAGLALALISLTAIFISRAVQQQ